MATAKKSAAAKPSTAVAVKKASSGAIVNIQEQLKAQAAAMAERTQPAGGDKIQVTRNKSFKLPNGQESDTLQAVIVDFVTVHSFYDRKYDEKNPTPPACFAVGFNPLEMVPTDKSPNLQNDACKGCPNNEFGSDGNGKACKNGRRLALLPPGGAGEDFMLLDVSPTAIKGFDGYVSSVATKLSLPPVGVVTTISFDPNVDYPKLVFSDPQPNEDLAEMFARQEDAKARLTQLPDFSQYQPIVVKGRAGARK